MNKKTFINGVLSIVMIIMVCYVFANPAPFWSENIEDRLTNISVEDIELTILDEETICLENLVTYSGLSYSWNVTNYVNGEVVSANSQLCLEENRVIQLTIEEIEKVEFQAVVSYQGYTYKSEVFGITENGELESVTEGESTVSYEELITRDISDIVSLAYVVFLFVVVLLYYIVPKSAQWIILLLASIFFYTLSGIQYILFIIVSALTTFYASKAMSLRKEEANERMKLETDSKIKKQIKNDVQAENRHILQKALFVTLGFMIVIKYSLFLLNNVNAILHTNIEMVTLVMPLGLSFYSFILIAYLLDVYRGKYKAEQNFAKFFLFISFFPQVSQGPIARHNEVAPQLSEYHSFKYENLCRASQRILWGFFVKLVLADRIALFVNAIYDDYSSQSWLMLILASLAYSIQIYADFYSSMEIAIGTAEVFGIRLQENFLRPYFSTNMPEFWRRWHATLGSWFKDYVFYPISISKKLMKFSVKVRKKYGQNVARVLAAAPPIMGVWILTGLWHGASWKFVAWGMFHGILILLSTAFSDKVQSGLNNIGIKTEAWYYKILQMGKVFILCTIGRVFFRANRFLDAIKILLSIATFSSAGKLFDLAGDSLERIDYIILIVSILLLLLISGIQEKVGSVRDQIAKANICVRWTIWFALILAVLILGVYGPGTVSVFIYEAF